MIHSIDIGDFRIFNNNHIKLGKSLTAIAGRNGMGKSTLLAMLGNSCSLKNYSSLLGIKFETKFDEIFKGDINFDPSGYKYKVNFSDIENINEIVESKHNRVAWQNNKARFRMIPETKDKDKKNSRKYELPVLYLGLSRLYPIGESKEFSKKKLSLDDSIKNDFISAYKKILCLDDDDYLLDSINLKEAPRKKGVGINSSKYSSILNSAGQDNLGQIILAVLSFKSLKDKFPDYSGGLLLIDEIDATLRHYAQIQLINYLLKMSRDLNLQIVFTTHSENILKMLYKKTLYNKENEINNVETVYLVKKGDSVKVLQSPSFYKIKSDLLISDPSFIEDKISVIFEDEEAAWFFEKILYQFDKIKFLELINLNLGCEQLERLLNQNAPMFQNCLFVFDGDVNDNKIENHTIKSIKLPGGDSPENVIYNYLANLDENHEIWTLADSYFDADKEHIVLNGPNSARYKNYGAQREKNKAWFKANKDLLEKLCVLKYWVRDNKDEYNEFFEKFKLNISDLFKRFLYFSID